MTSEELRKELDKQLVRESYEKIVNEYKAARKLVAEVGDLSADETEKLAMAICTARGVFDSAKLIDGPKGWGR